MCQLCQLSCAKQFKLNVKNSKTLPSAEDALFHDKYETGNFVSLDQYMAMVPGWLPKGLGSESTTKTFYGGKIFCDAASKYIHIQIQVLLGVGETIMK